MKIKILLLTICFVTVSGFAQKFNPTKTTISHNSDSRDAWEVILPTESTNDLKRAWKNYLNDKFNIKLKGFGLFSNKDILYAEEVKLRSISPNKFNFYTQIIESDEKNTLLRAFIGFNEDKYLESNTKGFKNLKEKVLLQFIKKYVPKFYNTKVEETSKYLDDLKEDTKDKKNDIENKKDKIKKLKEQITDLESKIEDNYENIEEGNKELIKRKEKLTEIRTIIKELK